ncbi:MAG: aldo/keto reductase [Hyphomonadaceae bacterium]
MDGAVTRDPVHGVRRMGFGVTGPLGSKMFSARKTDYLIRAAFEMGVRLFDTGPSYGLGEAERRLGETLKFLPRAECTISTRAGIVASGMRSAERDFSPDGVRRSIEGSMQRLGVHWIDWLFLHGPAPEDLTDGLLAALEEERNAGRIHRIGVTGRGAEIDAALATGQFQLAMAPVHAGLLPEDLARLRRVREAGLELIGIEVLAPALSRYPAPTSLSSARRLARSLVRGAPPAPRVRMAPDKAINWALHEGGAHRILVTTTRVDRLEANARAVHLAPPAA